MDDDESHLDLQHQIQKASPARCMRIQTYDVTQTYSTLSSDRTKGKQDNTKNILDKQTVGELKK